MGLLARADERAAQLAAAALVTVGALGASFVLRLTAGNPDFPVPSSMSAMTPAIEQRRAPVPAAPTALVASAPLSFPAAPTVSRSPALDAAPALPAAVLSAIPTAAGAFNTVASVPTATPATAAPAAPAALPDYGAATAPPPSRSASSAVRPTPPPRLWRIGRTDGDPAFVRAAPRPDAGGESWSEGTLLEDNGQSAASGGQLWRAVRAPDGSQGWTSARYLVAVRESTGARP